MPPRRFGASHWASRGSGQVHVGGEEASIRRGLHRGKREWNLEDLLEVLRGHLLQVRICFRILRRAQVAVLVPEATVEPVGIDPDDDDE